MVDLQQKLYELKSEAASLKRMLLHDKDAISLPTSYMNIVVWGKILINHVEGLKKYKRNYSKNGFTYIGWKSTGNRKKRLKD